MKKSIVERRFVEEEIRVSGEGEPKIVGHAALFDVMSQPMFGFREVIKKGAFKKTIKEADIRALFNHDPNFVMGRRSADTLTLKEDDKGLSYEIDPPDTQWANDLMVSMRRGDVNQSSFGFMTVRDKWRQDGDVLVRELLEVRLFDVSVVTFPAYEKTKAQVRSILDSFGIESDLLAAAMFKAQAGQKLCVEEQRAVTSAMDVLRTFNAAEPRSDAHEAAPPEPGHSHSRPGIANDLEAYLSRLRLLEL